MASTHHNSITMKITHNIIKNCKWCSNNPLNDDLKVCLAGVFMPKWDPPYQNQCAGFDYEPGSIEEEDVQ